MNKFSLLLASIVISSFSVSAYANTEVSQEQIDAITTECTQEAKDAIDQGIYKENCIEDKLQALKAQSGQSQKERS